MGMKSIRIVTVGPGALPKLLVCIIHKVTSVTQGGSDCLVVNGRYLHRLWIDDADLTLRTFRAVSGSAQQLFRSRHNNAAEENQSQREINACSRRNGDLFHTASQPRTP